MSGAPDRRGAADSSLTVRLPFQVVDGATVPARTEVDGAYDESGHCTDAWMIGGRGAALRTGTIWHWSGRAPHCCGTWTRSRSARQPWRPAHSP